MSNYYFTTINENVKITKQNEIVMGKEYLTI